MYILHQTVIIVIAYFVIAQPWRPGMKYWLVLLATLLSCVLMYELLIKRSRVLRVLFGMKLVKPREPSAAGAAVTSASTVSTSTPRSRSPVCARWRRSSAT